MDENSETLAGTVPEGWRELGDDEVIQLGDAWNVAGNPAALAPITSSFVIGLTVRNFKHSYPQTPYAKVWRKVESPSPSDIPKTTLIRNTEQELRDALDVLAGELSRSPIPAVSRVGFVIDGLLGSRRRLPDAATIRLCLSGEPDNGQE